MRRRDFISAFGGTAVAWPLAVHAQQSALPVIGFLSGQSTVTFTPYADAFRKGLNETGYIEGQNVTIESRWADGQPDRLPGLAADLVRRQVKVIAATGGIAAALAAKAETTTIPIVFNSGDDPVKLGLVTSLNRPDGNLTGISWFNTELAAKRLALLLEIAPAATSVVLLADPNNRESEPQVGIAQDAARSLGRRFTVLNASTPREIDTAFAALVQERAGALIVASGPFFVSRREQIIALARQYAIPTMYSGRESPSAGGLMSYGNILADAYRRNGIYVGRILKGDKPSDLPIDRSVQFELVINLKTAKALGLTVAPQLLARADEVIE
jgi:putative tryptophan/tyrosine transport system substrate-binding protein